MISLFYPWQGDAADKDEQDRLPHRSISFVDQDNSQNWYIFLQKKAQNFCQQILISLFYHKEAQ